MKLIPNTVIFRIDDDIFCELPYDIKTGTVDPEGSIFHVAEEDSYNKLTYSHFTIAYTDENHVSTNLMTAEIAGHGNDFKLVMVKNLSKKDIEEIADNLTTLYNENKVEYETH
jgi:hypothetical protein